MKQRKWGKKEHKMYILKRIGAPEIVKLEPRLVLNEIKERPDGNQ